jgi:threonine synthase
VRAKEKRLREIDPHSAIAYRGASEFIASGANVESGFSRTSPIIFLATAHPAKFAEIVDPIIGRLIEKPAPLARALNKPRHIIRIEATFDAVRGTLAGD